MEAGVERDGRLPVGGRPAGRLLRPPIFDLFVILTFIGLFAGFRGFDRANRARAAVEQERDA